MTEFNQVPVTLTVSPELQSLHDYLASNAHTLSYAELYQYSKKIGSFRHDIDTPDNLVRKRCMRLIQACFGHYANLSTTGKISQQAMLEKADSHNTARLASAGRLIGYSAKYAIEYFPRVKVPSYALWCLTLKNGHRYNKLPDGYGAAATFEDAKIELQTCLERFNLDPTYLTTDMPRWGEIKKLIVARDFPPVSAKPNLNQSLQLQVN